MPQSDTPQKLTSPQQTSPSVKGKRRWLWLIAVILIVAGVIVIRRIVASHAPDTKTPRPTPVVAVPARKEDVPVYLNGLGSVVPINAVTVKSRVDGQLLEVRFTEGQDITKGSLLAVIDPRPFQVQLTQAEGQQLRDQELLRNAQLDLERYKTLWDQDSIPRQQLDTQQALMRQYEGAVKIDQGQIDSAKLNLTYCQITAPVSGRVGLRLVDPGNMVHATDAGGLVMITQDRPITVVFPLPEDSLPKVLARMRTREPVTVEAWDREMKQKLAMGTLLTVDNQIDPATGTVKFKATFPNSGNELFPNQFVNAKLLVETKREAVIIPAAAVQRGPQGAFVFLLNADKTVAMRPVKPGVTQGDDITINEGLAPGNLVVVEGAERLRDGGKVEPKDPAKAEEGRPGRAK
ncbi:MAG: MdtA/MuxA family multidrug efflux RND transporter periplasmic adaptor subunit [Deltaproteobacteria bacterium]|nr:MdtA/MuxA family multidrug efflux RND transporter periplasmic adaptor subunit [Deltaproteobacteria bacterium]